MSMNMMMNAAIAAWESGHEADREAAIAAADRVHEAMESRVSYLEALMLRDVIALSDALRIAVTELPHNSASDRTAQMMVDAIRALSGDPGNRDLMAELGSATRRFIAVVSREIAEMEEQKGIVMAEFDE